MDRQTFIQELVKCLKENDKRVSEKETAKGSYESLLFSYPRVEEKGVIALLNEVTDFLIKEKTASSNSFLPDYFVITTDLLDGIQYCIDRKEYTPELRQALIDLSFSIYFLIPFHILKYHDSLSIVKKHIGSISSSKDDLSSICIFLLQHLNNGISCQISLQHINKVNLFSLLSQFQILLLSQDLSSLSSYYWPELLYFARDVVLHQPSIFPSISSLCLPIIQYYNGNHPLSQPPHSDWSLDYHIITFSVIETLFISNQPPPTSLLSLLQQLIATTTTTLQSHHLQFIQSRFNTQSPSYLLLASFFSILHSFILYTSSDSFTFLQSAGVIQLLYAIVQSYPPSLQINDLAKHCLLLLGLHNQQAFTSFSSIAFVKSVCISSANLFFFNSIYRILYSTTSAEEEAGRIHDNEHSIAYLEDIKESLAWVSSSPILKNLATEQKESLTTFVTRCRNEMQTRLGEIMKEEEEHQKIEEEVKEKNYTLEKELYKSIITQAKQINVQLVYGKNKCDLSVCYNRFRSISSAI